MHLNHANISAGGFRGT